MIEFAGRKSYTAGYLNDRIRKELDIPTTGRRGSFAPAIAILLFSSLRH